MKPIAVAIETIDENLDALALRTSAAETHGVRAVLNAEYADKLILVTPEPSHDGTLPPVRLSALKAALEPFGVTVATPTTVSDALTSGPRGSVVCALKELRKLFRDFKSNPLHDVEIRGKEPADEFKRNLRAQAKAFRNRFYEDLARFIVEHPALTYRDYWDADHRPYERQWPEYRRAVKRAKELKGDDNDALHDAR